MMYMNREYSFEYFRQHVFSEEFLIVTSNAGDIRSQKLLKEFPSARYVNIEYSVQKNTDGTLDDSFIVNANFNKDFCNKQYRSLYQDLRQFILELHNESKSIIIDISGMHLRFLGAFLATMTEWNWASIICTYTETTGYPHARESFPYDSGKIQYSGGFDLNSSFWGYDEIPNLKTTTSKREDYIWIAFLGFEGKRSAAVYTEISDDSSMTIPVITMPSARPGWTNYAFDANQVLFENAQIPCADIQYTNALDPFAAYNLIEQINCTHPKRHLVISPLGTRPVSLGVILFALRHEDSEIYFVTPKESCSKIIGNGPIHVYDILSFFEESDGDSKGEN